MYGNRLQSTRYEYQAPVWRDLAVLTAGIWLMAGTWLGAAPAQAAELLVLLDNSRSIERLSTNYQEDIVAFLETSPDYLAFAPIGDFLFTPDFAFADLDKSTTQFDNVE